MLHVLSTDEVFKLIDSLSLKETGTETVSLAEALFRVTAEAVTASEYVPGFDRSTVDGYAVRANDTFGCSESIPAMLPCDGAILMGEDAGSPLPAGTLRAIPTGGALPEGADCVIMKEYTEDYGDGTIGIFRPVSPGENVIYRGDDVKPGQVVLPAGKRLTPPDIGALAAIGCAEVCVRKKPKVAILSTGDELIPVTGTPEGGQIRDVNSHLLCAFCQSFGAEPVNYGIIRDDETLLGRALDRAVAESDMVLLSGGSSVGDKDASCRIIESRGELLMHGIAMKPGKPTILGIIQEKPVFGLPGHPAAAAFSAHLFVKRAILRLTGAACTEYTFPAVLSETLGANHGRTQYNGVRLVPGAANLTAVPIRSKSGLITTLSGSDGYISVPGECEGISAGEEVMVHRFDS